MKVKLLSRVRLPVTPWTAAYQAPPSMGLSRQEYWSGVPLPSPPLRLSPPKGTLCTAPFTSILSQATGLRLQDLQGERTWGGWWCPLKSSESADVFLPKGLEGHQGGGKDVIGAAVRKRWESGNQLLWCLPGKMIQKFPRGKPWV